VIIKKLKIIFICVLLIFLSSNVNANSTQKDNNILFIFDASRSMLGNWESGRKIDIAKNMLINMLDSLKNYDNLNIGLRVYGNRSSFPPQDCDDSHLEVEFLPTKKSVKKIKQKLNYIQARGSSPIAYSLEKGANDFINSKSRNIVILITDGKEECKMDPCAVSRLYQKKGIILKPFIIGIGLDESWKKSFDCVGRFFDVSKENEFENVLNIVVSHIIDNTTTQVNLLDENNEALESNVNISFIDEFTNSVKYNYIHTLNSYGLPDTMIIDPVLTYKVKAHTLPPVSVDSVKILPGKHTIIPLKTPQGELIVKMNSRTKFNYIVRKSGVDSTLNVQRINTTQKYITGKYDIEILTIPRIIYKNVEINQSKLTEFKLPSPGSVKISLYSKSYGGIYYEDGDNLEQVYFFRGQNKEHKVSLMPGRYKIITRSKSSNKYISTKEKNIKIKSGKTEFIKL